MERFILFYSKFCVNSREFIQELSKSPDLYNKFEKYCVDDENIRSKLPNWVKAVPTIAVPPNQNTPLVGENAMFWIKLYKNHVGNQSQQPQQNQGGNQQNPPWGQNNNMSQQPQPQQNQNAEKIFDSSKPFSDSNIQPMDNFGGFSDNFSSLTTNKPMEHSFNFLGNDQKMQIVEEKDFGNDTNNATKDELTLAYERMQNQRNSENQSIPRQ